MNNTIRNFFCGSIVGLIIGFIIAFIAKSTWMNSAVEANAAYYHPITKEFTWRTNSPIKINIK